MKYARKINGLAVDVVDGDPSTMFHPTIAAEFEVVPDDVVNGSRWDEASSSWMPPLVVAPDPAVPNGVPASVTARQARLALLAAGLLDDVETTLADPAHRATQIEWEYATQVERESPLVDSIGGALGLTSEQIDALFRQAATL